MKLTRKKALEICIELWTWLAETGRKKKRWEGWQRYGRALHDCPFCEMTKYEWVYGKYHQRCFDCPLTQDVWGNCFDMGFDDWEHATTLTQRKKYAKIFLERLLELK